MANNNPFIPGGAKAPWETNTPTPASTPMPGQAPANDNFEVDLTDVEVSSFTIPDGIYKVKCMNVEQTVSKGGNPMFVWDFEVSEGPHVGFKSKVFTAITPAAMWKVAETVIALGVGQQGSVVKFKRSDVLNKECGAMFEQTEYEGKNRSQIARVMTIQEMLEASK